MKKLLSVVLAYALVLLPLTSYATCLTPLANKNVEGPPYLVDYTTGANQSCIEYYLDTSGNGAYFGNLSVTGNTATTGSTTNSGITVYPPLGAPVVSTGTNSSTVYLSTCSTINPTATVLVVVSTGANINMAGCQQVVPAPVIATATATAGQWLVLESTSELNVGGSVIISSSAVNGIHLGSATRSISQNSVLTLIFDGVQHIWKEVSYTGE
jgi:hypothetical protein